MTSTVLNFENDEGDLSLRRSLLKESEHLSNSERLIDEQIEIAARTHDTLIYQRSVISSLNSIGIGDRLTSIGGIIKKIRVRKRKETIILALVIALCLGTMLIYFRLLG